MMCGVLWDWDYLGCWSLGALGCRGLDFVR